MLLTQVINVGADRLEDPQPQESQQADERQVEGVGRLARSREHGFELQVRQPEGGRLRWHGRAAYVVGGRVLQDVLDDTGPIEPGDDRQPTGDRGRLVPPDVLKPPQVELEVVAMRGQRGELSVLAPGEEHSEVGLSVRAGGPAVARQVGEGRQAEFG